MDVLTLLVEGSAPPLSSRMSQVPKELERIVGVCLEPEPNDRYRDLRALIEDLEGLRAGLE